MKDPRFEALVAMNRQASVLAGTALLGIDQKIAMIAVWGVHHERYEQALIRCEARGVSLTEAELYELAQYYRREWRIDEARDTRPNCFLCDRELPVHEERLCQCFRAAEVGVFISDGPMLNDKPTISLATIHALQRRDPRNWENIIVETICCVRCSNTEAIPASIIAASLRQGKTWVLQSRKFCQNCFQKHQTQSPSNRPPAPSNRPPQSNRPQARNSQPVKQNDINAIQQIVAHASLPVGES